ncbi:hypothetical protein MIZ03_4428 [Rhodoferax lithotrophicus]|uniref:Uncharacterized protein n=1 Tax=Rhodoferax lithotrophicus TaxID=2798804 RepID=A0ABM7MT32_9BURK|nr:hypothetical protein MIZ03_4428 [Rhodoferax sp. MIZ03]
MYFITSNLIASNALYKSARGHFGIEIDHAEAVRFVPLALRL